MSDALVNRLRRHAPDARRTRHAHPKGFEPGVAFDASGAPETATVTLDSLTGDEAAWAAEIQRVTGLPVPDDKRPVLEDTRFWGDPDRPMIYARFRFVDRGPRDGGYDPRATLREYRSPRRRVKPTYTGPASLVVCWNDWQVGKVAPGGGTDALVHRFAQSVEATADRARELRRIGRDLGELVIIGGGDLVEGCTIYQHQAYALDADRREQVNTVTDLILHGLDTLAPLFRSVRVLAVGGNHGENRVDGRRITRSDNDDLLVFEMAARATHRDPRLGHVTYVLAHDEPAKTIEVQGHILATTHGDVFGRGQATPEQKAWKWYQGQAAGHQPAGDAHLFVTHHYHHHALRDWGACLWVQTPALDGGSPQHTDATGQAARPGVLTWVMTPQARYTDPAIV